ncbi:MAG: class I SAM-dependent methyltransferase, partial [bacterium]
MLQGTVLDVGGGRYAPHDQFWADGVKRIRVDLSDRFKPQVVGDARALPFLDASVDAVVMCEVLEHLPDPRRALEEAYRVLKPRGRLCGSVPFIIPIHGDPHDYFRYTEDGLRTILGGFRVVKITPHGNAVSAAWRLVTSRFRWLVSLNPLV